MKKFGEFVNEAAWNSKQQDIIVTALERLLEPFVPGSFKAYPQKIYITFSESNYYSAKEFIETGKKPVKLKTYIKGDPKSLFDKSGAMNKFYDVSYNFNDKKMTLEFFYKFNKSPEGKLIHLDGPLYRHELAKLKGEVSEVVTEWKIDISQKDFKQLKDVKYYGKNGEEYDVDAETSDKVVTFFTTDKKALETLKKDLDKNNIKASIGKL